MSKRIGIFSGTFDPMHVGHVEACLVALGACKLDQVLVMIEKSPTRKSDIADYKHRKKMVELSLHDIPGVHFYEHPHKNILFANTLPDIQKKFPSASVCMIIGSDVLEHFGDWPDVQTWLPKLELCVVLRANTDKSKVEKRLQKLPAKNVTILPAVWSPVSSSKVKQEIVTTHHSEAVHKDVLTYIYAHQLYKA